MRPGIILALLVMATAGVPVALLAQTMAETRSPDETVSVAEGGVFEISAQTDGQPAMVTWVLTRDRTFVEAGRERLFRVRLTQPGAYLLEAAADFPMSGQRVRKNILLDVQPQETPVSGQDSVRTVPPSIGGTVGLPEGSGILTLVPSPDTQKPIVADTDTEADSDGDGANDNDDDTAGTLFSEEGNSLSLWFVFPRRRSIAIRSGQDTQRISLVQGAVAGIPAIGDDIVARDVGGGDVFFSFETGSFPENIVHQWNFGDGRQSMVRTPTHRYLRNGSYEVTVTVRDLQNGSTAGQSRTVVQVTSVAAATETGTTLPPDPATPGPETPSGPTGSILPLLLRIAIIALLAIGLGALAMWIVSKILRRTGGSLQQRLENAEATLAGTDKIPAAAPATLELRRPAPAAEVVSEPEPAAPAEPPAPAPTPPPADFVDVNQAPAWLKQGLQGEKKDAQPETPAPAPAETPYTAPSDAPLSGIFARRHRRRNRAGCRSARRCTRAG